MAPRSVVEPESSWPLRIPIVPSILFLPERPDLRPNPSDDLHKIMHSNRQTYLPRRVQFECFVRSCSEVLQLVIVGYRILLIDNPIAAFVRVALGGNGSVLVASASAASLVILSEPSDDFQG
jgi:hypothetical protein